MQLEAFGFTCFITPPGLVDSAVRTRLRYASSNWICSLYVVRLGTLMRNRQCDRSVQSNRQRGNGPHDRSHAMCLQAGIVLHTVYSRHLSGGPPPQKNLQFPPIGCRIVCSESFLFGRDNESQIYHGNFLLMDNKHRKLFVIKQSKGCRFMHKMYRNTSGGRAPPAPAGRDYAPPPDR